MLGWSGEILQLHCNYCTVFVYTHVRLCVTFYINIVDDSSIFIHLCVVL